MVHLFRSGLGVSRTGGSLNRPRLSSSHATQVKTAKVAGKEESRKDYNDISSLLSTMIPKQRWPMHPLLFTEPCSLLLVHTLGGDDLVGQDDILVTLDFLLPDRPGMGKFIDIALILKMKAISSDSS